MRALIIDDHPLFREAMTHVVNDLGSGAQVDEAESLEQAIVLLGGHGFDLILLDLGLPGASGLSSIMSVRGLAPTTPLIIVSASDDPDVINQALRFGVSGYLPKSLPREVMATALNKVMRGDTYFPALATHRHENLSTAAPQVLDQLTPRQMAVLQLMAEGKQNKTIAYELNISQETAKLHISAIFRKLGVSNRTQAILVAHQVSPGKAN